MSQKSKNLFLLRHGKSAWDHPEIEDRMRALLPEGVQRTEQISNYLKEINVKIDKVISSPAKRAFDTATIIKEALNLPEVEVQERLYPCNEEEIFNVLIEQDDSINNILIVGHNPGLTYFAQDYMDAEVDNLPTSALVSSSFETGSWTEFLLSKRKFNFFVTPKKLK